MFFLLGVLPKRKQTKRVLVNIYFLHKARVLYYWEVAANTKLFQDYSLAVVDAEQNKKNPSFFLVSHSPKN